MTLKKRSEPINNLLRRAAFTLMEMLVVVAIIVVLAGVGGAYLIGQLEQSKISAAKAQAVVIANTIDAYKIDHSAYPGDLSVLLQKDADGFGPYLKTEDALKDPWGQRYQYDPNGSNNSRVGAVVQIPDVYCMPPGGTMVGGNWKEPKH